MLSNLSGLKVVGVPGMSVACLQCPHLDYHLYSEAFCEREWKTHMLVDRNNLPFEF